MWSQWALMVTALGPKVPASLSMAGSALILHGVWSSPSRQKLPYHRLLAGLSMADLMTSLVFFLGTWVIPRDTPDIYGALGTQETCSAAGFLFAFSSPVAPMYNAALAFYYLVTVRYNWSDRRIARIEKMLHPIFWLVGLGIAVTGLYLTLYNGSAKFMCWIEHKPSDCLDSFRYGKDVANCERGDNAYIYQWAFYFSFGWLSFLIMLSCLTSVYFAVLNIEKRRDSYRFPSSSMLQEEQEDRTKSRRVFEQGLLYGAAFVLSWIFQTLNRIHFFITGKVFPPFVLLAVPFAPLQGFWNYLIYQRRLSPTPLIAILVQSICCCMIRKNKNDDHTRDEREGLAKTGSSSRCNDSRKTCQETTNNVANKEEDNDLPDNCKDTDSTAVREGERSNLSKGCTLVNTLNS